MAKINKITRANVCINNSGRSYSVISCNGKTINHFTIVMNQAGDSITSSTRFAYIPDYCNWRYRINFFSSSSCPTTDSMMLVTIVRSIRVGILAPNKSPWRSTCRIQIPSITIPLLLNAVPTTIINTAIKKYKISSWIIIIPCPIRCHITPTISPIILTLNPIGPFGHRIANQKRHRSIIDQGRITVKKEFLFIIISI